MLRYVLGLKQKRGPGQHQGMSTCIFALAVLHIGVNDSLCTEICISLACKLCSMMPPWLVCVCVCVGGGGGGGIEISS